MSILVVERSATLSHLLARTLQAAQLGEWSELPSYTEALDHLRQADKMGNRYRVLLLGAPPRMTKDFQALLDFLRQPRTTRLPVIVLAHERTPEIAAFAEGR